VQRIRVRERVFVGNLAVEGNRSTWSKSISIGCWALVRVRSRQQFTRMLVSQAGAAAASCSWSNFRYALSRRSCTTSSASSPTRRRASETSRGSCSRARSRKLNTGFGRASVTIAAGAAPTSPTPTWTFPSPALLRSWSPSRLDFYCHRHHSAQTTTSTSLLCCPGFRGAHHDQHKPTTSVPRSWCGSADPGAGHRGAGGRRIEAEAKVSPMSISGETSTA
jgi:hypothetical protein